jgi:hypothetical protein
MVKVKFATAQKARIFTTPIVFGCDWLAGASRSGANLYRQRRPDLAEAAPRVHDGGVLRIPRLRFFSNGTLV